MVQSLSLSWDQAEQNQEFCTPFTIVDSSPLDVQTTYIITSISSRPSFYIDYWRNNLSWTCQATSYSVCFNLFSPLTQRVTCSWNSGSFNFVSSWTEIDRIEKTNILVPNPQLTKYNECFNWETILCPKYQVWPELSFCCNLYLLLQFISLS